ncbi:ribonuclease Oy [Aplysia californica]|uniref:Ribonuclease Oy n=1 Tax=Aplysia californica TaxID=6500 RepID=A0ABM0JGD0_APLCA|nr:ribonuclease Oy [Aplysia californica]XP_035824296.1 ribonuclease Oy [Aplysia californica]
MDGKLFLLLLCACECAAYLKENRHKNESFDYLVLAQFWPATSCYIYFGKEHCSGIPKAVTGWTIHGLWPSSEGEPPQFCNTSAKFEFNKIKGLSTQLNTQWPYYNTSGDTTFLWAHEWEKHGTCATSVPALNGEFNYFNSTLTLQKPLNISGILAKHGILPSLKVKHRPQEFFDAIKAELGTIPNICCVYDEASKQHYIEQVYLCYSKSFQLQDCPYVNSRRGLNRRAKREMVQKHHPHHQSYFDDCPAQKSKGVFFLPFRPPSMEQKETVLYYHSEFKEVISWH